MVHFIGGYTGEVTAGGTNRHQPQGVIMNQTQRVADVAPTPIAQR